MINVVRVSIRGQVAIPKSIREKLSIKEGDILIFEEREGKVYIRRVKSFFDFEGSLPSLGLSIDEIREKAMDEMAKEAADV